MKAADGRLHMTHSEEELAFFHQLGLAVSQWAHIEINVYQIVAAKLETEDRYAIGFGMFAMESFWPKLAFADAFLRRQLKDEALLKEWSTFFLQLRTASQTRNKLAHWRTVLYSHSDAGRRFALERWPPPTPAQPVVLRLGTRISGKKKLVSGGKPPSGALCLRDIIKERQQFYRLSLALQNFHAKLSGRPLPHPISSIPTGGPPTIREVRIQMREALERPPKPSRRKP